MTGGISKKCRLLGAMLVAAFVVLGAVALPSTARADDAAGTKEIHIKTANDFLADVALSREQDTSNWVVYLDNDIDLTDSDMQTIVKHTVKHLSFGNSEHPFAGIFDGQNHTVTGLKYPNNVADPERDTGFFAETKGATIKNFLVKDADVWADFRGGIIVGKAVDTTIENVMVMESTLHVTCANNALNLITNAGFEGGIIAGELDGCKVYNCEVRGGRAVNNTTSGVQALGGEGLYMAAFAGYVGKSDAGTPTTIEYSRVTPTRKADGSVDAATDVTNKYDVAVGALGGNNVYASGFVGRMGDGAQIIDCFSTAKCYSYSASYVGVVAVTLAWSGGLAGRIDKADGNAIVRSHYAGDLSSRQYNPVAVIPIIQNDVNLGGIAGRANNGDATITDCYFKPSVSTSGSSQGDASKKTVYALAGDKTASGASFGPWSDDRYVDRTLWESHDYDFAGGITRSTDNGKHINKWVMDYKLGIPVHGESVKATLDFPGAGEVTIKATKLGKDQKTSNPYSFAVSAVLAGTAQGLAEGDTAVTFAQKTGSRDTSVSSDANEGYRFMGWFRERDVTANSIDEDSSWFDGKTDDKAVADGKRVEENGAHDVTSEYTADNAGGKDGFKDNDLFIASYQAQVLFHNVNGAVISAHDGSANSDTGDDWYRYGANVAPATPQDKPESGSATFIGWTNKPGTYKSISSGDLSALKSEGRFFAAGQPITVTEPMDFYPVYTDYSSNIITVFEGNEQDGSVNTTLREGVGSTGVVSKSADNSTAYTVEVRDASGKALADGGKLPDGYRFLGWYETKHFNGKDVEVRVSRDTSYALPADVDLTVPHTYTARFEYRVDYYGTTTRLQDCELDNPFVKKNDDGTFTSIPYASSWQKYESNFVERKDAPLDSQDAFDSWHEGPGSPDHGKSSECTAPEVTSAKLITEPFAVHAHVTGDNTTYNIGITDDFPGAASLSNSGNPAFMDFSVKADVNDGYKLLFWDWERSDMGTNSADVSTDNPWKTGTHYPGRSYLYTAHLIAEVNFHWKDGSVVSRPINGRRYQEKLLGGELYTYTYPFSHKTVADWSHSGNPQPTNSEMAEKAPGYKFLGWITTAEVEKDSDVWNYIYDVPGDAFVTSDPAKATPYLVTDDYTVTQAQDVYPVYAKYDVRYTTNLHRAGFDGNDTVNVPKWDIAPALSETDGVTTASVEPDISTTVYKNGGELYKLNKVEIEKPDGTHETLQAGDGSSYSCDIDAGGTYTFVAYYTPLAVAYHLNASDVDGKVAQDGDVLGNLNGGIPEPTFKAGDIDAAAGDGAFHAFAGWTTDRPAADGGNFVIWSSSTNLVNASTVVHAPMELFPVYRATTVKVQSNIDDDLDNPGDVRALSRTENGDQVSLSVSAVDNVMGKSGTSYDFVGWSRDYKSDDSYTLMTSEADYALEGAEPFENATYTAVYKVSPLKVRYHDSTGAVIYEADVEKGSARARAGFIHQVTVPKVDEDGNPVYDDDGNQETEKKDVAYDSDAYVDEAADLARRATDHGGDYKEMFREWQWIKGDGTVVAWDDFKDEEIKQNMDLYPNTFYVIAHDTSNGAAADAADNVTAKLKWQLDPNAKNTVADGDDEAPIRACFAAPFTGTQLTITVKRVSYETDGAGNVIARQTPDNGFYVSLYSMGSGSGSFDAADYLQSKKTGDGDQGAGNAVFDFEATHVLTIVKQTTDADAAGKTFRFTVTRAAEGELAVKSKTVEVTVGTTPDGTDANGAPLYKGEVKLMVPAGSYTVAEDAAWSWRYKPAYTAMGSASSDKATVNVSAATSVSDATVTCSNTRAKDVWIDGSGRCTNVWSSTDSVTKKK